MTDHTWIAPVSKQGTIEYRGHVLHLHIYTEMAGFDDEKLPLIITGRLCALNRIIGPGIGFRVTQNLIEAPPERWNDE